MIIHVCQCSGCSIASNYYPNAGTFPGLAWTVGPQGQLVVSKRVILRLHDDKVGGHDGEPPSSVCILGQKMSRSFPPAHMAMRDIQSSVESYMERYTCL